MAWLRRNKGGALEDTLSESATGEARIAFGQFLRKMQELRDDNGDPVLAHESAVEGVIPGWRQIDTTLVENLGVFYAHESVAREAETLQRQLIRDAQKQARGGSRKISGA